ncbi:uncharacterized protein LODBEIA_P05850 [Lodderomyces beijingensis]|uniref:Uncharacterized protein n=1 Tax=Lodderomyces beijingensis TaxID=1775926 RepID=A0ABP0ZHR7_9ASCO
MSIVQPPRINPTRPMSIYATPPLDPPSDSPDSAEDTNGEDSDDHRSIQISNLSFTPPSSIGSHSAEKPTVLTPRTEHKFFSYFQQSAASTPRTLADSTFESPSKPMLESPAKLGKSFQSHPGAKNSAPPSPVSQKTSSFSSKLFKKISIRLTRGAADSPPSATINNVNTNINISTSTTSTRRTKSTKSTKNYVLTRENSMKTSGKKNSEQSPSSGSSGSPRSPRSPLYSGFTSSPRSEYPSPTIPSINDYNQSQATIETSFSGYSLEPVPESRSSEYEEASSLYDTTMETLGSFGISTIGLIPPIKRSSASVSAASPPPHQRPQSELFRSSPSLRSNALHSSSYPKRSNSSKSTSRHSPRRNDSVEALSVPSNIKREASTKTTSSRPSSRRHASPSKRGATNDPTPLSASSFSSSSSSLLRQQQQQQQNGGGRGESILKLNIYIDDNNNNNCANMKFNAAGEPRIDPYDDNFIALRLRKDKLRNINELINVIIFKIMNKRKNVRLNDIKLSIFFKDPNLKPIVLKKRIDEHASRASLVSVGAAGKEVDLNNDDLLLDYVQLKHKLYIRAQF